MVEWADQGCVVQMTGSALTGFWGERTRRAALWLLEHQAVHVLATDAHDLEKRVPILSTARDAAAEICGEEIAEALVEANPRAIITNQTVALFPAAGDDELQEELAVASGTSIQRNELRRSRFAMVARSDGQSAQVELARLLRAGESSGWSGRLDRGGGALCDVVHGLGSRRIRTVVMALSGFSR